MNSIYSLRQHHSYDMQHQIRAHCTGLTDDFNTVQFLTANPEQDYSSGNIARSGLTLCQGYAYRIPQEIMSVDCREASRSCRKAGAKGR